MIPPIDLVHSVEMIRDGGSLAVVFQGVDRCQYWFLLPIKLNIPSSGEWERIGYEDPVIVDRMANQDILITWEQALIFLSQVRPFLKNERDLHWHEIISEAVRLRGELPNGVDRDFGRSEPTG